LITSRSIIRKNKDMGMYYRGYKTDSKGTIEEPVIGDVRNSIELNKKIRGWYIWQACEGCKITRWVQIIKREPIHKMCADCRNIYFKDVKNGMTQNQFGDIKFGNELGLENTQKYIYKKCDQCKQGYWIRVVDSEKTKMCRTCYDSHHHTGEEVPNWVGGYINKHGYRTVTVTIDSPYYVMGQKHNGNIRVIQEHRLVMAMSLGRPLETWEMVHHKGTKYPIGSWEDKHDNRIENLSLESHGSHQGYTTLQYQIICLEKKVMKLEEKLTNTNQLVKFLMWERKRLEICDYND
jgi:hypothetical protein